ALGAILQLTGVVSKRGLEKALLARVPPGTDALNKKALAAGVKLAKDFIPRSPDGAGGELEMEDI
ncbi:MAG: hypothetical protein K9K66_18775, partial [Desulfarculaceae bacterium]|nr:hypothetical protein [Desulfarculaceae bacterium]MCF8074455.1 hypothetical protein [Desulfarculaceae bacterium]MCF8103703.1 hypothetical protein [Desulfarculaceae bacterium]MCF8118125.1 hypothetical protein [Desulfarculaceae bacterium]